MPVFSGAWTGAAGKTMNVTTPMIISDEAIKYILFQRTAYLRLPQSWAYRAWKKFVPVPTYVQTVELEARFRGGAIRRLYEADMRKELDTLAGALPPTCRSVLDIGCGVAGFDVLLAEHYAGQAGGRPDFHLLDKTRVENSVFYGFKPHGAFYSSLDVARRMMVANGTPEKCVHLHEATATNEIGIDGPVDLIVSLISWGFHYPLETYLNRVCELLGGGGMLIVDVRKGTGGLELLRRKLGQVSVLHEEERFQRIRALK